MEKEGSVPVGVYDRTQTQNLADLSYQEIVAESNHDSDSVMNYQRQTSLRSQTMQAPPLKSVKPGCYIDSSDEDE